jgi:hypothetical protein
MSALMRRALGPISLLVYFAYFCGDALEVFFAPDDMMNMGQYWRIPPWNLLSAQFQPWHGFYRPAGGLFYMPLFHFFGLRPTPYHVAILAVLLINVWLIHRLAGLLGCHPAAAALTALLACYHAGLTNLTYNIAFVYDVLCGFFYLAALVVYLRDREQARGIPLFLVLYLGALNSKEMAVTLPGILLVYEWCYHRAPRPRAVRFYILGAILLTALSVYGKVAPPGGLASQSGYRPVFSLARALAFQVRSFSDLFAQMAPLSAVAVAVIWLLLTWLVWRRPRPLLRFCWLFLLLTPLPIEFLEGRGGACLYIPFAGWAILVSTLTVDCARPLARGRYAAFVCLLAAAGGLWASGNQRVKTAVHLPAMAGLGAQTRAVIAQFDTLRPRVPHGSTIVFLNDPFADWDMAFIADLWFRDRSLNIKLQRKTPMSDAELARATVFDYRDYRLIRIW